MSSNLITKALIAGTNWAGSTISFSFPTLNNSVWSLNPNTGYDQTNTSREPWVAGYDALEASQQGAVRGALNAWAAVSGLAFKEVSDNANVVGDLRFGFASLPSGIQAWAYLPNAAAYAGDVWFSTNASSKSEKSWGAGSYEYMTALHEIGHALGLKHPFDDKPGNGTNLSPSLDSRGFTVMSYSAFGGQEGSYFSYEPTTPMVIDIMTIQHLYGKDMAFRQGDNTYLFDSAKDYHQTIWDSGGVDTIIHMSHSAGIIDLRAGYDFGCRVGKGLKVYSEEGAMLRSAIDNVWIAFGSVIENATGGTANDAIYGNQVANRLIGGDGNDNMGGGLGNDTLLGGRHNDRLSGGLGNDTLDGGGGNDRLVFNTALGGNNIDTIVQFGPGLDKIELDNAIFTRLKVGAMGLANFVANASGNAVDSNDFIVYETDTGKLFYDADGSGGGAKIQFALVGGHPTLTAGDFFVV
jgi:serralysin